MKTQMLPMCCLFTDNVVHLKYENLSLMTIFKLCF